MVGFLVTVLFGNWIHLSRNPPKGGKTWQPPLHYGADDDYGNDGDDDESGHDADNDCDFFHSALIHGWYSADVSGLLLF